MRRPSWVHMSRGHHETASPQSDHQCEATHLDVEAVVLCIPCGSRRLVLVPLEADPAQSPLPTWVNRDDATESSSVDSESCWGEMEDLIGEEKVEWGLLPSPAAPAVQSPTDVVEALERDLLSNRHNVESGGKRRSQDAAISTESPTRHGLQPIRRVGDPDSRGALLQREGEVVTESDTESCEVVERPSRRSSDIPQSVDSHDQRLARVRQQLMEEDDVDGEESESDKEGAPSEVERCEEDQSEDGEIADAR